MIRIAHFSALVGFALLLVASPALAAPPKAPAMNRNLPEVKFDNAPLPDAIEYLRDLTNSNISVNWRALESIGVTRATPINMHLRNVSLRKAIQTILTTAAEGDQLAFHVDANVIEITTRELADKVMVVRTYNVSDLLLIVPNFEAPKVSFQSQNNSTSGGSSSSRGGMFGGENDDDNDRNGNGSNRDSRQSRRAQGDQLVELITSTISPEVWQINGGPASIKMFRDTLVVNAPRSIHQALSGR